MTAGIIKGDEMKSRIFLLNLVLTAVLLASCAPKAAQPPAPVGVDVPQAATPAPVDTTQPQQPQSQATEAPVQVIPTSRGDKLQATDPATVSLASGDLQMVEFFRFT